MPALARRTTLNVERLEARDTPTNALVVDTFGNWWRINTVTNTRTFQSFWRPNQNWTDIRTGDFNGDGRTDIVGRTKDGYVYVGLDSGYGLYNQLWSYWSPTTTWTDVRVGDFNGDRRSDLMARNATTGAWSLSLNTGGYFLVQHNVASWGAATWRNVVVGDFNGDGRDDVAGMDPGNYWYVSLRNSFNNGFVTQVWGRWSTTTSWLDVHVGDFNGDGRKDLIGRAGSNGTWWVARSNGLSFVTTQWGAWANVAYGQVRVTDINGDGRSDLVGRRVSDGAWCVALSTGFSLANQSKIPGFWNSALLWTNVVAGDFNGDGKRDEILGHASATGEWYVLNLTTGVTRFIVNLPIPVGGLPINGNFVA